MYFWQTEIKIYPDYVLDIAHDSTSQDSKTFKLQKREFNFSEFRLIKIKHRPIKNHRNDFSVEFYFSPNTTKMFRVSSETQLGLKGKP